MGDSAQEHTSLQGSSGERTYPGNSGWVKGQLHPPIYILPCPAGHYWTVLNPTYIGKYRLDLRKSFWCPEHQEEKKEYVKEQAQKSKLERSDAYSKLGLPPTKQCLGCKKIKKVSANRAESEFYIRRKKRSDGGFIVYPDSKCKVCCRAVVSAHWASLSKEEKTKRSRRYHENEVKKNPNVVRERNATNRAKKREAEGREKKVFRFNTRDGVTYVLSKSFRAYLNTIPDLGARCAKRKLDSSMVARIKAGKQPNISNDVADRILLAIGGPYRIDDFWDEKGNPLKVPGLEEAA